MASFGSLFKFYFFLCAVSAAFEQGIDGITIFRVRDNRLILNSEANGVDFGTAAENAVMIDYKP